MKRPFFALLAIVAWLAPAAATATPVRMEFRVTLTATLFESRSYDISRSVGSCEARLAGGSSTRYTLHSGTPTLVVVRRVRSGAAVIDPVTLRRLVGIGSEGGSATESQCPQPAPTLITDCGVGVAKIRNGSAILTSAGGNTLGLKWLQPLLPMDVGCPRKRPAGIPQLDLSVARGSIAAGRLFDPKVRVIKAVGAYAARMPVRVEDGTATVEQRVRWQLTFTRA